MADDAKSWIAIMTSALAVLGTIYSSVASRRSQVESARLSAGLQRERDEQIARRESQSALSRFRDPLMHASYDLQSRIYGIVRRGFLARYYTRGSEAEKEYAVENTVFLVAQFLGWTEAIRDGIQFLDLEASDRTRELRRLQDEISGHFRSDVLPGGFRLFAGEQRAVGELMLSREGAAVRCMGFAAFVHGRTPAIDHWLDLLRSDIHAMASDPKPFEPRLLALQHALVDLLAFLDPTFIRFPPERRKKVQSAGGTTAAEVSAQGTG